MKLPIRLYYCDLMPKLEQLEMPNKWRTSHFYTLSFAAFLHKGKEQMNKSVIFLIGCCSLLDILHPHHHTISVTITRNASISAFTPSLTLSHRLASAFPPSMSCVAHSSADTSPKVQGAEAVSSTRVKWKLNCPVLSFVSDVSLFCLCLFASVFLAPSLPHPSLLLSALQPFLILFLWVWEWWPSREWRVASTSAWTARACSTAR